jgi:hypothetical protein
VAQVGRISGPLLTANLERNGIDLAFETDLIYFDVSTGRVGIRTNSPTNELHNPETTRTTKLIVDTQADFTNIINIQNSDIQPFPGSLFLDSEEVITANRVKTDDLLIDDDRISTYTTDTNIEFRPNGTGRTEFKNLWVENDIDATGNINIGGNIRLGNQDSDNLIFEADVTSDIVPDADITYNLGSPSKSWQTLHTKLINGDLTSTVVANVGSVEIGVRPGKLLYVSTNGANDNTGTHIHDPYRTIDYAVTQASAGDTILVMPGEYEETCPIEVPTGVTIRGTDIRNTIIRPPASDNYVDVFLLNGESSVTDLTVKDFYYDIGNDVGYAFRFANNATITTRSPYIQNITVITTGSVTSADDPRGFAEGDAGKGALVDGADVLGTSEEASMLFHSVTFITPGVDALTMTNGVRVEWLNSFTYFANRGFYAVDGVTGHLSTDGSTVKYGAEIRSIGSANVYGNYGAVADGADTLMYLIQHNMAYIGVGKYVDNDPSRVIQANEIVKLNSGKIYYQTVNHFGDFRIGDNFFINAETGESSIVITEGEVQGFGRLRVTATDTGNVTIVDGEEISTGNLQFRDNISETIQGDYNFNSASGEINLNNNTTVTGNTDITGNLTFGGTLNTIGDSPTDTVDFNTRISQNFNPNTTLIFDLGSSSKEWSNTWLSSANIGDVRFQDNFVTTDVSNANLELRANGSGILYIPTNSVQINNNLTVSGNTDLQSISVTGVLTHTGTKNFTGNYSVTNLTITGDLTTGSQAQFEEILFDGNVITTTTSDADLELRANGTGEILVPNQDVTIPNNFEVEGTSYTKNINNAVTVEAVTLTTGDVNITSNVIDTSTSNSNLELRANGTGEIYVPTDDVQIDNNLTVSGITDLQSTNVTTTLTHVGNYNQTGNYTQTGDISIDGEVTFDRRVDFEDVSVDGNVITTNRSNSDLELRASGTSVVRIKNNTIVNNNLSSANVQVIDININNDLVLDELTITDSNVTINDNYITTETSNANLELRATGDVVVNSNDVTLKQNLTVNGDTDIDGTSINGDLTHTGNRTQTGNYTITGDISVSGGFAIADQPFQFEDILIDGNVLETTLSNSNLDIRANGTGTVNLQATVDIASNLTVRNVSVTDIVIDDEFALENMVSSTDIDIFDNVITTTNSNSNLELRAAGTGNVYLEELGFEQNTISTVIPTILLQNPNTIINATGSLKLPIGDNLQRVESIPEEVITSGDADDILTTVYDGGNANVVYTSSDIIIDAGIAFVPEGNAGDIRFNNVYGLFEGFSVYDQFFGGVFSQDTRTNVQADSNLLKFTVNNNLVAEINQTEIDVTGLDVNNVTIRNNTIKSTTNTDLLLTPDGTGDIVIGDTRFDDNKVVNTSVGALTLAGTSDGYIKVGGALGTVLPAGNTSERRPAPVDGEFRWNTEDGQGEIYNGTQWIPVAGVLDAVTEQEFLEILDETILIFG